MKTLHKENIKWVEEMRGTAFPPGVPKQVPLLATPLCHTSSARPPMCVCVQAHRMPREVSVKCLWTDSRARCDSRGCRRVLWEGGAKG